MSETLLTENNGTSSGHDMGNDALTLSLELLEEG